MRGLLLLIGLNFEIVVLVGAAIWIGSYLTKEYPQNFSWYLVTVSCALAAVVHSIYRAWKLLMAEQKGNSKNVP